jgi:hypothetical protein
VRAPHFARRFDRDVEGGMRRQLHVELREADMQQGADRRVAASQRFAGPLFERLFVVRAMPQGGEDNGFEQRAVARIDDAGQALCELGLQRTSVVQHRVQRFRCRHAQRDAGRRAAHAVARRSRRALR